MLVERAVTPVVDAALDVEQVAKTQVAVQVVALRQNKILGIMNILFIGKYPPIQGGVSAASFIFTLDLAKKGHSVHVLTNANEVESGYRQNFDTSDTSILNELTNNRIKIHDIYESNFQEYQHIPFSKAFSERLFGRAISIIEENKIDFIVGWYFQPYGFVSAQIGRSFNIPYLSPRDTKKRELLK